MYQRNTNYSVGNLKPLDFSETKLKSNTKIRKTPVREYKTMESSQNLEQQGSEHDISINTEKHVKSFDKPKF